MFRLIDRCVGFSYSVAYVAYRFCIDIVSLVFMFLERNTGVEPASQAWEARALPMC